MVIDEWQALQYVTNKVGIVLRVGIDVYHAKMVFVAPDMQEPVFLYRVLNLSALDVRSV